MAKHAAWGFGLLALVALAYANALGGPFIFDDRPAIVDNPSIRSLWPPWFPLFAPRDNPTAGRPVANLTLALNYAMGGLDPRGYRLFNLTLHASSALLLLGLVQRTLAHVRPPTSAALEWPLAFASAALWAVHPLTSECVNYVVQRTESLMALSLLAMLYAHARSTESPHPARWRALAVASCALGMASKEVMVVAPLVAVLYDAAYQAGSVRDALRRSPRFYAALASTWLLLAALVLQDNRPGSVGGDLGVTPWRYLVNQAWVVAAYLRTMVWPRSQQIDYGWPLDLSLVDVAGEAALVLAVVAGVAWLWRWRPRWGFPAVAGLLVLVPSSTLLPIATEVGAERRVYLPLAGGCVLAVLGVHAAASRIPIPVPLRRGMLAALLALVLAAGVATTRARNRVFADEIALWQGAVALRPANPRAHVNLGAAWRRAGDLDAAGRHFREALALRPSYPRAVVNLGQLALDRGRTWEAESLLRRAVEMDPRLTDVQTNLGALLFAQGRYDEAIAEWREVLRKAPDLPLALNNLAWGLATAPDAELRDGALAVELAQRAVARSGGDSPEIFGTLGAALAETGRWEEAVASVQRGEALAVADGDETLARSLAARAAAYRRQERPELHPVPYDSSE